MAEPQPQPPAPASEQAPPPSQRAQAIAQALAAAMVLEKGAEAASSALTLTPRMLQLLTRLFGRWGYRRQTIRFMLRVVTRVIPAGPGELSPAPGPALEATIRHERTFTGWFLERTTARVEAGYAAGMADGEPEKREDRFIDQHLDAQDRRRAAARKVDAEAAKPGQVADSPEDAQNPRVILLWRAHPDDKVTPECRAADGAWFYADQPPIIGYPGMPHGGTCRCWPAHAGSLAAVARGRHVNEAVRAIISQEADHRPHPASTIERTA